MLNNLGSCELDEDDLMLDLEFTEEQQLRKGKQNGIMCLLVIQCYGTYCTILSMTIIWLSYVCKD